MSVRSGDRTEGKLSVLVKSAKLKAYSLDLLRKEKIFPKSTRWLYANPIANAIRDIDGSIRMANAIYVTQNQDCTYNKEELAIRYTEQIRAHGSVCMLYGLVEDAYSAGYIAGDRCEYWVSLIKELDDALKGWIKSDKQRYKNVG